MSFKSFSKRNKILIKIKFIPQIIKKIIKIISICLNFKILRKSLLGDLNFISFSHLHHKAYIPLIIIIFFNNFNIKGFNLWKMYGSFSQMQKQILS